MPANCNYCAKSTAIKRCGSCKRAFYCDKTCQRKDWKNHKNQCKIWRKQSTATNGDHIADNKQKPYAKIIRMKYLSGSHKIYYKPNNSDKYYILIYHACYIYKYNVEKDKLDKFATIPMNVRAHYMGGAVHGGYFIDTKNNKLYLISTMGTELNYQHTTPHDINIIITLDLNTKQWNVLKDALKPSKAWNKGIYCPKFHFINDMAHIIYLNHEAGHHEIFDFEKCRFVELDNNANKLQTHHADSQYTAHCVYVKTVNKLFVFQFIQNTIWSLDLNEGIESKWKPDIEFIWPHKFSTTIQDSAVVFGFGCIIYIFARNKQNLHNNQMEIWCVDVLDKRWYKSDKQVPGYFVGETCAPQSAYLSTGGRYAHFIEKFHDKIDLYDVSSNELKIKIENRMRNDWKKLVFGYIRREIQQNIMLDVPDDLQNVLLSYYSIFP